MTIYGVSGTGKLGRLLLERPNFICINGDPTSKESLQSYQASAQVVVNCSDMLSVDECESNPSRAIAVNVRGTDNIHSIYGQNVLTVSSNHVFSGNSMLTNTEESPTKAVNRYGWAKIGAEVASQVNKGKIIRLSRVLSLEDSDISTWIHDLKNGATISVPTFFYRNYLTISQAVDGLEFAACNFRTIPKLTNFGATESISMYNFMLKIAEALKLPTRLVLKKKDYDTSFVPRPQWGGFSTALAQAHGFPKYPIRDVVESLCHGLGG